MTTIIVTLPGRSGHPEKEAEPVGWTDWLREGNESPITVAPGKKYCFPGNHNIRGAKAYVIGENLAEHQYLACERHYQTLLDNVTEYLARLKKQGRKPTIGIRITDISGRVLVE